MSSASKPMMNHAAKRVSTPTRYQRKKVSIRSSQQRVERGLGGRANPQGVPCRTGTVKGHSVQSKPCGFLRYPIPDYEMDLSSGING